MAVTQGALGGLRTGLAAVQVGAASRKQQFDQRQKRAEQVSSSVDDIAKTLAEANEQFSIQKAAARTPEEAEKITGKFGQLFDTLQNEVSRVTQVAVENDVPVDPQLELAKLLGARDLADLRAEQVVEAAGAGRKAGAQERAELQARTAEQPLAGAEAFVNEQGETIFVTETGELIRTGEQLKRVPQTRIQVEQQPPQAAPAQQEFQGVGQQVMEDIRQSTGIAAGLSKGISRTGGQFVPGVNPRLDAEQRIKNFNQEVKFAFSRNPRFPVAEIERIQGDLLPDPEALLTDPEAEANKIPLLRQNLLDLNESDRLAFEGMSDKGKKDALDRMATRQAILNLIGEVPPTGVAADEADTRIDALEQKGLENLSADEKNELRQLLRAQGLL